MKINIALLGFIMLLTVNLIAQEPPNILIIQVDDLGYNDLSINGNILSNTPNLDALSLESVRFDNFMVHSVCAPTRASLLTGRDFWRTGVSAMHGGKDFLNLDETTFANILQDNGYATGMWGKWHSGKADGYFPWDRGFDEAYLAKLYNYFPSNGWYNKYPSSTTHTDKWSAEVLVDYTIDFISKKKDEPEPFLAYLSFLTCHDEWSAPKEYISKYKTEGRTERFATLLGMLEYMDAEVGRLLEYLSVQGLDENTVVLFMSDNGPNLGDTNDAEWALRNNQPFLGSKSNLWQNGLKSPLYVRWTNSYQPQDISRLVAITDIFPTLLDIAAIALPPSNKPLDGRSIKAYLEGDTSSLPNKEGVFAHWYPVWDKDQFQPMSSEEKAKLSYDSQRVSYIGEAYKLIRNAPSVAGSPASYDSNVLIDLIADPLESTNVASSKMDIVNSINSQLSSWFDEIKATEDSFNAPVFQIGWNEKMLSEVPGSGPSKITGLQNEAHWLGGFSAVGDTAEYTINVHVAGTYKISMNVKDYSNLQGFTFTTSCAGEKGSTDLLNQTNQEIATLYLPKMETTFSIELTDIDPSKSPNFGKLKTLDFELIETDNSSIVPGLISLSKKNNEWVWWNIIENSMVKELGFSTTNITMDVTTSAADFIVTSDDTSGDNLLKLGGLNGAWLPTTAFCGSGNSSPIVSITYQTSTDVSGKVSMSAKFDGVKKTMSFDVGFSATDSSEWKTLQIPLNTSNQYVNQAEKISLLILQMINLQTPSGILDLKVKEIKIGSDTALNVSEYMSKSEADNSNKLYVYPSPASTSVHVKIPKGQIDRLLIFDSKGQLHKTIAVFQSENGVMLDVEALEPGLYFLFAESKTSIYTTKLMIKN